MGRSKTDPEVGKEAGKALLGAAASRDAQVHTEWACSTWPERSQGQSFRGARNWEEVEPGQVAGVRGLCFPKVPGGMLRTPGRSLR